MELRNKHLGFDVNEYISSMDEDLGQAIKYIMMAEYKDDMKFELSIAISMIKLKINNLKNYNVNKEHIRGDMVNHPNHYNAHPMGIEVIDIVEHGDFCIGNAIKYIMRSEHKGNEMQDLSKAIWYLERKIRKK